MGIRLENIIEIISGYVEEYRVWEDSHGYPVILVSSDYKDDLGECSMELSISLTDYEGDDEFRTVRFQVRNILEDFDLTGSQYWPKLSKLLLSDNHKNIGKWCWEHEFASLLLRYEVVIEDGKTITKAQFWRIVDSLLRHAQQARRDILIGLDSGVWPVDELAERRRRPRLWRWLGQELVWPWRKRA